MKCTNTECDVNVDGNCVIEDRECPGYDPPKEDEE